tara:strand:+ start:13 stop:2199 length:2187 start_codon:yes stop_codon:yes gene_type:complete
MASVLGLGPNNSLSVRPTSANATFYIVSVDKTTGNSQVFTTSSISINPSTGTITANNFVGTITNANFLNLTSGVTDKSHSLVFFDNDGNPGYYAGEFNTNLQYNPFTGILTSPALSCTSFSALTVQCTFVVSTYSISTPRLNNAAFTNCSGYLASALVGNITPSQLDALIPATKIADGSVSDAEFQFLDGVTSNIQAQINTKAPLASPTFTGTVIMSDLSCNGTVSINRGLSAAPALDVFDTVRALGSLTVPLRSVTLFGQDQDGATFTNYNGGLASWNGIGFESLLDNVTRFMFATRTGDFSLTGKITGGTSSSGNNFFIDSNDTATGILYLQNTAQRPVYIGNFGTNVGLIIQHTQNTPLRIITTSSALAFRAGVTVENTTFADNLMVQLFSYKHTSFESEQVGIKANSSAGNFFGRLYVNCTNNSTNSTPSLIGNTVLIKQLQLGDQIGGTGVAYTNDTVLQTGRSFSFANGLELGGWTGAIATSNGSIRMSTDLAIDPPTTGDLYLNYFGSRASPARACKADSFTFTSDRRIKMDFEAYDDEELMSQIMQLEVTTYHYKDPAFKSRNVHKQLGFIADTLVTQSYFQYASNTDSKYNIPFDTSVSLVYTVDDDNEVVTVSNYTFDDLQTIYYFYAYPVDGSSFRIIESKPLSSTSFTNSFKECVYSKIDLIGTKVNDCKTISKDKLVSGAYAGVQILYRKIQTLEERVAQLESMVQAMTQQQQSA